MQAVATDCKNREHLIKEAHESYGIEVFGIADSYIDAQNTLWGRNIKFRFPDSLNFEELFKFNGLKIDREKFFRLIRKLDSELFMTVEKKITAMKKEKMMLKTTVAMSSSRKSSSTIIGLLYRMEESPSFFLENLFYF